MYFIYLLLNKCSPSGQEDISRTFGFIMMNGAIAEDQVQDHGKQWTKLVGN